MGKKKTTKQTSGMEKLRIEVDFDYDKLAEAIVKANQKQEQVGAVSREWMKTLLSSILWPAALMGAYWQFPAFCMVPEHSSKQFPGGLDGVHLASCQ